MDSCPSLRSYAQEYYAFIATPPDGGQILNNFGTIQEVREHVELWDVFEAGLEPHVGIAQIPTVKNLRTESRAANADPISALGTLYAFEVQQPATAQSKLAGLRAVYHPSPAIEPYFEVHSRNTPESEKLLHRIEKLSSVDQQSVERGPSPYGDEPSLVECAQQHLRSIYDEKCMPN